MNEEETTPRKRAGDWFIIALDETQYWYLDEEAKDKVTKINGIYAFDRRRAHYLCEMTPSYEMCYLGLTVDYIDDVYHRKPDSELDGWVMDFEDDIRSNDSSEEFIYYHCSGIDRFIISNCRKRRANRVVDHVGNISGKYWRDETYEGEVDDIREYWNAGSSKIWE